MISQPQTDKNDLIITLPLSDKNLKSKNMSYLVKNKRGFMYDVVFRRTLSGDYELKI